MVDAVECCKCGKTTTLEDSRPWGRRLMCVACKKAYQRAVARRYRERCGIPAQKHINCGPEGHTCGQCGKTKPADQYHADKTMTCGHRANCKECANARRRERWANNVNGCVDAQRAAWESDPETHKRRMRTLSLRTKFGITPEQYELLLEQQGGVCYLCHRPASRVHHKSGAVERLHIDHDRTHHEEPNQGCPGCIRGLLCHTCNQAIMGNVDKVPDSPLAARFADYRQRRPLITTSPRSADSDS